METMTHPKLDNSLREAAEAGTPVEVVDPATNRVYYLAPPSNFKGCAPRSPLISIPANFTR